MSEKRFTLYKGLDTINIMDNTKFREQIYINKSSKDMKCLVGLLNELAEENSKIKKEISSINDLLNEYYKADTSKTPGHKLRLLLRELDCYRKAHNTVDWQAYKEKEFEGL